MRILLVEDEPALASVTARMIGSILRTARIEVAATAAEAIAAIQRDEPAIVLSDFDLADGSTGGEILAWIVLHRPQLATRFVFVSGNPVVEEIHNRSLMKPYSMRELRAELTRA